jgi:hypothetical protein
MLTSAQRRQIAQHIWRRASSLPDRATRVRNLQRATNLAALARTFDGNPKLGLDKWPPGIAE